MKTLFIAIAFLFSTSVFSQSIINTLGTNGEFTIKDSASNFLKLNQTNGLISISKSIRLRNTTDSLTGVIYKENNPFLHNYGVFNLFLGINSGNFDMTGDVNLGLGELTLRKNSTGNRNIAFGRQTLFDNTTGDDNIGVGFGSLYRNISGSRNVGVGGEALTANNGNDNTAIGFASLNTLTTGDRNTAIGNYAGNLVTTGSNLTLVGYNSEPSSVTATNEITLGDGNVTTLRCNTQTITSLSDMRDKKNIQDLSLGLDFLMTVKPRQFNWDKREWYEGSNADGSKMKDVPTAGFIAQELDEAQTTADAEWLSLVLKTNPERIEASYNNLLPVMVKAIQELKAENDELKKQNEVLASEVNSMKTTSERLAKLERMMNEMNTAKHTSLNKDKEANLTNNR